MEDTGELGGMKCCRVGWDKSGRGARSSRRFDYEEESQDPSTYNVS